MEGIFQKTLGVFADQKGSPQLFCVFLELNQQIKEVLVLMVAACPQKIQNWVHSEHQRLFRVKRNITYEICTDGVLCVV